MNESDNVKNPAHYTQFEMQPIEFIQANLGVLDPFQANIIKYVCRFRMKNGLEDLNKAQEYLDRLKAEWLRQNPPAKPAPTTDVFRAIDGDRSTAMDAERVTVDAERRHIDSDRSIDN